MIAYQKGSEKIINKAPHDDITDKWGKWIRHMLKIADKRGKGSRDKNPGRT